MPSNTLPVDLVADLPLTIEREGDVVRFQLLSPDREQSYETGIIAGMREMVRKHRDPRYQMTVPIEDARSSLALALACQEAAVTETRIDLVTAQ